MLGAESSLDEVRVSEALKDESPALVHELQRLEYKLNILLRLTADIALRNNTLPAPQRARLGPRGLEWFGAAAPLGLYGIMVLVWGTCYAGLARSRRRAGPPPAIAA